MDEFEMEQCKYLCENRIVSSLVSRSRNIGAIVGDERWVRFCDSVKHIYLKNVQRFDYNQQVPKNFILHLVLEDFVVISRVRIFMNVILSEY